MTAPGTPGGDTVAATPTTGGNQPYAASGAAGVAGNEDAPDNQFGSVHRPGFAPGIEVGEGPAVMKVGKKSNKKK